MPTLQDEMLNGFEEHVANLRGLTWVDPRTFLLLKTAYAAGFVRATEIGNSTLRAMVKAQREPVALGIGRG